MTATQGGNDGNCVRQVRAGCLVWGRRYARTNVYGVNEGGVLACAGATIRRTTTGQRGARPPAQDKNPRQECECCQGRVRKTPTTSGALGAQEAMNRERSEGVRREKPGSYP